ncbi:GNAT family N-acetyltransferase [Exiguobacterium sp. RIT594]|uniref:GNAT family N-acetyltransferase n=1 Tax=Exiguobacterium sp. RIT594 TaxID=2282449 RepID=UPI000DF8024B|nr:GNAT family N-acetyltransferase [Exiguobacterium sp. RIT594]RDB34159.1 N-acetyltransferase [Exiguobacterium sp. RIT594]
MNIRLEQATDLDAQAIFDLQVAAFLPLLETYQDYATNPANETIDRVYQRINYPNGRFFKIIAEDRLVGAICILWKEDIHFRISPIFLAPNAQGNGFAQQAMRLAEARYPQAETWELSSLLEETKTCQLYEKMGYVETCVRKPLNDNATLIHYQKIMA